ncbi:inorganic polyphosphate/ATP-NAD kinase [Candidatus Magnetobacterium bavaricum]|uniref:Inorganic polyphosphate/ATP-NAD kinase n=1 Tax=Candidatus Magnetobacterium bavaricum TaxID=29290 RepID=A0A0F3H1Y6_9BACT|nr:inorganic polyphosphate/ATP-NAD kinase [Candidatus Magnetobacterium bavaricum]
MPTNTPINPALYCGGTLPLTIDDLRAIGKRLMAAMPAYRSAKDARRTVQIGAGGDTTHPIDKAAEDIIISCLEALQKPMTIVSEELGIMDVNGGGHMVIIDPIDGSRNAVYGLPIFSTSIALSSGRTMAECYMGYIINLISGDEFYATKGQGAFLNGTRLQCQRSEETEIILYESREPVLELPKLLRLFSMSRRQRCLGSTALDIAYVASGAGAVFVSPSTSRSFDFAAGLVIVREAGGVITDIEGKTIDNIEINLERSTTILASANSAVHTMALQALVGEIL